MSSNGSKDLERMLSTLEIEVRAGRFVVVTRQEAPVLGDGVEMVLTEAEGTTVVARVDAALRNGWTFDFEAAWLTLAVHSSLEAVGLTAAVSAVLARAGLPCNVIAGYYHDHLLVPHARAQEAVEVLESLRAD